MALALATLSSSAFASDPSAEELKSRGNQAMMELNYAEALSAYRGALDKNPSDVALHYNIGRAHQARGDYPAALDALLEFEQKAPAETKAKVPSLGQLIADVKSRVGELSVHCSADVTSGTIVVDTTRVEGCTVAPKKVRISLSSKSAAVEVRLESSAFVAPNVKVNVEGGGPPADVALTVSPRSTAGILRVQATPAIAVISVDGSPKGNSPVGALASAGLPRGRRACRRPRERSRAVRHGGGREEGAEPHAREDTSHHETMVVLGWRGRRGRRDRDCGCHPHRPARTASRARGPSILESFAHLSPRSEPMKADGERGHRHRLEVGFRVRGLHKLGAKGWLRDRFAFRSPARSSPANIACCMSSVRGAWASCSLPSTCGSDSPSPSSCSTPNLLGVDEIVQRFDREARAAATLRSRHVVRVTDVEQTVEGVPYMVMELLEGSDLESERARRGCLPYAEVVDYVLQACAALAEAHDAGIVHRDLKPGNLFLAKEDGDRAIVKVLDFGISKFLKGEDAKLTSAGAIMGTAALHVARANPR